MENITQQTEAAAIMEVITKETVAFWNKDFEAWSQCWLHTPQVRNMGWWKRGGVRVHRGWEASSQLIKDLMAANPEPNPTASQVRRENINLNVSQDMAWVTFDQYGADTGEPDMDMPGASRETRILEKHDGKWKIVYVCWLLEGTP
jgi:hypothetical protein